jgi:hypothetical protein
LSLVQEHIKKALEPYGGEWKERRGVWEYSTVIAERKAFLSRKKLTYSARMRIDDGARSVAFSELLVESGSGLASGGGFDDGMSNGFGFKTESYNTTSGARTGHIEEQSSVFGKTYQYTFNYQAIRARVEAVANAAGYQLEYQVLPVK